MTGEPNVSFPGFADPAEFQIDLALNQLDGSYAAPFGLLGSQWNSGTATSPWKDANGTPIALPGSLMIGGSGEDFLIGNSGNDTLIGGTPAHPKAGVIDEVLVGGGGADVIYGGGGTELIFADLSAAGDADWADLDPTDADTLYGGSGNESIYGSGGNDVIDGGSGNYTIYTGNGDAYVETGSGNSIVNGGTGNDTIIAGSGADSITTGDGDDSIYSGDGQSTINAGAGDDTFAAGSGTTTYHAGTGAETYQLGLGAGDQTIVGGSSARSIQVTYTDGIASGDVVARDDTEGNLTLTDAATGSQLEIDGYFNGESNVSVDFGDGETWGAGQLLQASMTPDDGDDLLVGSDGNDTITGGPGDDTIVGVKGNNVLTGGTGNSTIYGGSGADTIEGGAGTNALYGGTGSETYVFNVGDGSDTITENTSVAGTDVLKFGSGISASDLTFAHSGNSNDLMIKFGNDTDSTIVVSNFLATGQSGHQVGSLVFADGTTLSAAQVADAASHVYVSDNGNDSIQGGPGNDTIYGGSGSDTLVGGPDDNLIVGGSGTESIIGGTGHNTLIGGSGHDTITAGPNGDLIETGTGYGFIQTGAGNDTVETTGGQDTLQASNGNDTYQFGIGSGQDTLENPLGTPKASGSDTLEMGAGLTASDLTFTRVGVPNNDEDDLVIGIKGTKDSFTIRYYFGVPRGALIPASVAVSFQDGNTLTDEQIKTLANQQSDWNGAINSITATNLPGYDDGYQPGLSASEFDGDGFDRGAGALALDPLWNLMPSNVASGATQPLRLGQGIRPQDIVLQAEGESVLLSIKGTHDSLFIPSLLDAGVEGYAITGLDFSDGTKWDLPTLQQHVGYGSGALGAPGQVVNITDTGSTFTPSGPNDTINAVDGLNLQFGHGDGDVILNLSADPNGDSDGSEPANTLTLGPGITPDDVSVSSTGLVFTLKDTGESLTVLAADDSGSQIDQVRFADGSSWDDFNIESMEKVGQPVSDEDFSFIPPELTSLPAGTAVLIGGTSDSTLVAGAGNTVVIPGDGNGDGNPVSYTNTVLYGPESGNTTIEGTWGLVNPVVDLKFEQGITQSDLDITRTFDYGFYSGIETNTLPIFETDGEGSGDLLLTNKTTGRTIAIPYTISQNNEGLSVTDLQVKSIVFSDGSTLDPASLILSDNVGVSSPGMVAGKEGAETLVGAPGDTVGAAFGNTVQLGNDQLVVGEYTQLDTMPAPTTYVFGSTTNADTINPNLGSTLQFAPGITESDVAVTNILGYTGAAGSDEVVYIKSTGAYVVLQDGGSQWFDGTQVPDTLAFADGKTYSLDQFKASSPYVATDASGVQGYYAESMLAAGGSILIVRGDVTNATFGNSAWDIFDAAAADVAALSPSMRAGIAPAALTSPVVFTFDPSTAPPAFDYDEISNYDANGLVIKLPDGITPSNVKMVDEGSGVEMVVTGSDGTSKALMIENFYASLPGGQYQEKPFTVQFADGTTWDDEDIKHAMWQGPSGIEGQSGTILIATSENSPIDLTQSGTGWQPTGGQAVYLANSEPDTLLLGRDSVEASQCADTFVISRSTNQAVIDGFDSSVDTIQFASDIDPNDIDVARDSGSSYNSDEDGLYTYTYGYTFSLRSTGQRLLTIQSDTLDADDQNLGIVQFANGAVWSLSDLKGTATVAPGIFDPIARMNSSSTNAGLVVSQAIRGTMGDESLTGGSGDDQIAAGVGNDTLSGGGGYDTLFAGPGNDTFVFGHGSGYDTIVPYGSGTFSNTLAFSSDVAASDVSVVRPNSGNDLELVLNDSGETVLLPGFLADAADPSVQQVTFSDGTTWDAATLVSKSHQGSAVAGYLAADATNESIVGGQGNDTLVGDANADALVAGSGNDLIRSGNGDNTITGGVGLDTIYGGSGSDLVIAGTGDMLVYGGTGAETYQFGTSFGHDTVFADPGATGSNVIRFVDGIDPSMVSFSSTADGGVLIALDANGDSILLPNHYVNGAPVDDISQIVFADGTMAAMADIDKLLSQSGGAPVHYKAPGTVITAGPGDVEIKSDNGNDTLVAGTGNDTLVGGSGTDVLDAGPGNDLLIGGSGQETYAFSTGFGQATVRADLRAVSNAIRFGDGIAAADVSFQASGKDLVVSVAGSVGADGAPSQITIAHYFAKGVPTTPIDQTVFSDGSTISMALVDQALAMSSKLKGTKVQVLPAGVVVTAPNGADTLTGDGGNDTLNGGTGRDMIRAGSGNDVLNAGSGRDTLVGGSGTDVLTAGAGKDDLVGGSGNETYAFNPGFGHATITTAPGSESNTILFGGDVTAKDLSFKARGNDLVIKVAGSFGKNGKPSKITLANYFGGSTTNVSSIDFSDGSSLPLTEVTQSLAVSHAAMHRSASVSRSGLSGQLPSTSEMQSAATNHATVQHTDALSPIAALTPSLGAPVGIETAREPYPDAASPSQGAPADPLISDPNDPEAGPGVALPDDGAAWLQGPITSPTASGMFAPGSRQRRMATAQVANEMIKALTAQGGLHPSHDHFGAKSPADEMRLQGGAMWSVSTTDRTLAALADGGSGEHSGDSAHAKLVSAMASFAPAASAESSPLTPWVSDAYAIAVAAQMH